jgi:hypothetical protein
MSGVPAHTKEHYDLMAQFERQHGYINKKPAYEPRDVWMLGHVYANGDLNEKFIAFREGYVFGKTVAQQEAPK